MTQRKNSGRYSFPIPRQEIEDRTPDSVNAVFRHVRAALMKQLERWSESIPQAKMHEDLLVQLDEDGHIVGIGAAVPCLALSVPLASLTAENWIHMAVPAPEQ